MTKPEFNPGKIAYLLVTCLVLAACGGSGSSGGASSSSGLGSTNNPPPANNPPPTNNTPTNSGSPSLTVSWQAPEENVDGSPVSGIDEYRIYYGEVSGQYDYTESVSGTATRHTIEVPVGQYFLVMTAIDIEGDESGYSNEVSLYSE